MVCQLVSHWKAISLSQQSECVASCRHTFTHLELRAASHNSCCFCPLTFQMLHSDRIYAKHLCLTAGISSPFICPISALVSPFLSYHTIPFGWCAPPASLRLPLIFWRRALAGSGMLGIHIGKHAPCNVADAGVRVGWGVERQCGEMQKGGQGTQVYLLHRQNLPSDIHPVRFLWCQLIFK